MKLATTILLILSVFHLESEIQESYDIKKAESYFSMLINQDYQNESRRLLEECGGYNSACFGEKMNPIEWKLADVSESPDANGSIIGEIVAYLYVGSEKYSGLQIGLGFRPTGREDLVDWMRQIGDWGYGINFYIFRLVDNWIQLPSDPFPKSAWIRTDNPNFNIRVYSIKDMLLRLPEVPSTNIESREQEQLLSGNYLIVDVTAKHVVVRPEIPSDMPCGEDITDPSPLPPTYEIDRKEMFDTNNKPRFFVAYPRGC